MIRTCRVTGSTSASSRTTSIARAGWTGGPGPSASPRCWRAIDADIVALQEVDRARARRARAMPRRSARRSAWAGSWRRRATLRRHQFGNVVLSRFPIRDHAQLDLSWKTCEPRNSQRVAIDLGDGRLLQVYNVHLGTALLERRYQAPRLAAWIHDRRVHGPKIVLGDFNEWGRGLVADVLAERLKSVDLYPHLQAPPDLSGLLPGAAPRPHLLRRRHRDPRESNCPARGWRWSPRTTCRSSPTSACRCWERARSTALSRSRAQACPQSAHAPVGRPVPTVMTVP